MRGNTHLSLDVGQANELKLAFRRYGWTNENIKHLCESDMLGLTLDILRGDAKAVYSKRIIDLSATPLLKDGHTVVKHLKQGKKDWTKLRLALMNPHDLQYTNRRILYEFQKKTKVLTSLNKDTIMPLFLKGQRPANICLRDFLLEHQHLVPRDWWYKTPPVLFWGTICRGVHSRYVPGMSLYFGRWEKYNMNVAENSPRLTEYENPCVVFAPAMPS